LGLVYLALSFALLLFALSRGFGYLKTRKEQKKWEMSFGVGV
jgi:hypothetical protein